MEFQRGTGERSDRAAGGLFIAAETDDGQNVKVVHMAQNAGNPLGKRAPRWRQSLLRQRRFHQAAQPSIKLRHAREIVQHALVHTQWAGRELVASVHFDQPPSAQRRGWSQRAPMRLRQSREREAEGRSGRTRLALSRR